MVAVIVVAKGATQNHIVRITIKFNKETVPWYIEMYHGTVSFMIVGYLLFLMTDLSLNYYSKSTFAF